MGEIVGLSFSEGAPAGTRESIVAGARQALLDLAPAGKQLCVHVGPGTLLLVAGARTGQFHQDSEGAACALATLRPYRVQPHRLIDAEYALQCYLEDGAQAFRDAVPPFGVCFTEPHLQRIVALTDPCGLKHLYVATIECGALVSTSSLILGRLTRGGIDMGSIGALARTGTYLACDSAFAGVRKLNAGQAVTLQRGSLSIGRYSDDRLEAPFQKHTHAVAEGTEAIRACVRDAHRVHPEATIELSGGLDSRLILAALGASARGRLPAITLGEVESPDSRVARLVADRVTCRHRFVDLADLRQLDRNTVSQLVAEASLRSDHAANPFSRAVLHWVNGQLDDAPRFTGQNGEFARGFYYPGQRERPAVTVDLVDALIRWRFFGNEGVDLRVITPGARDIIDGQVRTTIHDLMSSTPGSWLQATDDFYLRQRMQRWVGTAFSSVSQQRPVLAPFFDPRFLAWARRVPPAWKRGGAMMSRILEQLDPALARIPLDSGLSPIEVHRRGLMSRWRRSHHFVSKVFSKIKQRAASRTRPPVGAAGLCETLLSGGDFRAEQQLGRCLNLGFFDLRQIEAALTRGAEAWATLGFLLTLEWSLAFAEVPLHATVPAGGLVVQGGSPSEHSLVQAPR